MTNPIPRGRAVDLFLEQAAQRGHNPRVRGITNHYALRVSSTRRVHAVLGVSLARA